MTNTKAEIIALKKLKKDGSIEDRIFNIIAEQLSDNKLLIMPIDFVYGYLGIESRQNCERINKLTNESISSINRLIASFKMLEDIATIDKLEFDFLHRIWPGEMIVYLRGKGKGEKTFPMRIPKGKLCQDIVNQVNKPVLFSPLLAPDGGLVYQKSAIVSGYQDTADLILVIDEFCKEHSLPTILDISEGELRIINEGRVSSEEIKSLYFLGKDDSS